MSSDTAAHSQAVSAAVAGASVRPAVEFKGQTHPALRAVVNDTSPGAVRHALISLLDGDPDRFEWQPVIIDLTRLAPQARLDWPELLAALRAVRLHPVAVLGAPEEFRGEANGLQLEWLAPVREPARREAAEAPSQAVAEASIEDGASPPAEPSGAAGPDNAAPAAATAMVIERPVRSGQRIYARDCDLVIIGSVSPGAEVIADGNVHVYGALQGRAIAGARGLRGAAIFTLDLRAELVAVCGVYRTFDEGPAHEHQGRPVRIELDAVADRLSVRPL